MQHIIKLLFLFCLMAASYAAQAQKPDRFLQFRGGDSVWLVNRSFAPDRLYIGEKKVSFRTWRKHLQQGDEEVGVMIKQANNNLQIATAIEIGGLALFTAGIVVFTQNYISNTNVNNNNTNSILLVSAGLAASIIGNAIDRKAKQLFGSGVRLFNNKASKGTLTPTTLQIGAGPKQAGLIIKW